VAQDRVKWGGSCKHSNKPPGSLEGEKFLDCLSDHQSLKKKPVLWGS